MNTLIVYDSMFGNTERIARAIGARLEEFGPVRVIDAEHGTQLSVDDVDFLVVGGPTQRHSMSPPLQRLLDHIERDGLRGIPAAAFDTRYRQARLLTGSAAVEVSHVLKRKGARMVTGPESFFVERDIPRHGEKRQHEREHLEPGEAKRATVWVYGLAQKIQPIAV